MTQFASIPLSDIQASAARISPVVSCSSLDWIERLSAQHNTNVYCKREDRQRVRSYKIRGSYNKISQLAHLNHEAGVVAASAGNHAQGVAYSCKELHIPARIYVPSHTPRQKLARIEHHGGSWVEVISCGNTYDEAAEQAALDSARTGAVWVHAFNDRDTISGQGTIGLEVYQQLRAEGKNPDVVIIPAGGCGCLAGVAQTIFQLYPQARIIAVEATGAPSLTAAVQEDRPVLLDKIDSFVEGTAVRIVGEVAFELLKPYNLHIMDPDGHSPRLPPPGSIGVLTVPEGAVCTTILELYHNEGIIVEPAGALAATALKYGDFSGIDAVTVLISGGNNDVSRYGEIIERSLVHEGLKHYFLVDFAQKPGSLRKFLDEVLGPNDDITLFEYVKRNNRETGAALVGIQLTKPHDLAPLLQKIEQSPVRFEQLMPGTPAYDYLT